MYRYYHTEDRFAHTLFFLSNEIVNVSKQVIGTNILDEPIRVYFSYLFYLPSIGVALYGELKQNKKTNITNKLLILQVFRETEGSTAHLCHVPRHLFGFQGQSGRAQFEISSLGKEVRN